MSALTDIFLQLSNQIRKYLGTTTKYTPAQAILAIDEVYAAGGGGVTPKGNAVVADVLSGKTFSSSAGTNLTGEMPNNAAYTSYLNCEDTYIIPQGYHSGTGKVIANSLSSQTAEAPAIAATAERIINGYRAWVNGKEIIGSMPVNEATEVSLNCDDTYYIPAGYHNGSGRVTGTSLADQTKPASGYGAATSSEIASGYQAWVNGVRVTGGMTNHGSAIIYNDLTSLPIGIQGGIISTPIPQGYYDEDSAVYTRWQNKTVTIVSDSPVDIRGDQIGTTAYHYLLGQVTVIPPTTEEGEGTASTSNKTFYPTSSAFTSFTVKPTPSYQGSGTAGTSNKTVTPTSGNYFSSFVISPTPTEAGSATATTSNNTVYPSSGKYFSSFTIYPQSHSGSYGPYSIPAGSGSTWNDKYADQIDKTWQIDLGTTHATRYVKFTLSEDFKAVLQQYYQQRSGTYNATSRGASLDLGAGNTYRYVNTNSVPNTNSATYTYGQTNGGTVDLGATNTYRYVNAENVRKWVCVNMTSATASTTTNVRSVYIDTSGATGIYIIIASSPDKTLKSIYINTTNAHRYYDQMLINGNSTNGAYVGAACFGVNGSTTSSVTVHTDVTCAVIKVYKLTC